MVAQNDFYSDISQDEIDAASKNSALGFQSRWDVGTTYTNKVSGTPSIVYGEKFGNEELVIPVATLKNGVWVDAGELKISTGGAKPGSENANSLASGDAKAIKGHKAALRGMDEFLRAAVSGYANYETMTIGKKTQALDTEGNPINGKDKGLLDAKREVVLNKLIAAFAKGERLDMLADVVFDYTPRANERNPSFPYHSFQKHEDSAS